MTLWQKYVAWFDARNTRERAIIGVAVIGGILLLGLDNLVFPALAKWHAESAETQRNAQSIGEMNAQVALLQKRVADPDAAARVRLQQLQQQLTQQAPRIRGIEASLVPADKMAGFLKNLLARGHSLQLLSLKTLPPEAADKEVAAGSAGHLYKHGVEISFAGGFADIVAYLDDLEAAPQKLVWEKLELKSEEYPRSVVTLTLYTISLDKAWLVI